VAEFCKRVRAEKNELNVLLNQINPAGVSRFKDREDAARDFIALFSQNQSLETELYRFALTLYVHRDKVRLEFIHNLETAVFKISLKKDKYGRYGHAT